MASKHVRMLCGAQVYCYLQDNGLDPFSWCLGNGNTNINTDTNTNTTTNTNNNKGLDPFSRCLGSGVLIKMSNGWQGALFRTLETLDTCSRMNSIESNCKCRLVPGTI